MATETHQKYEFPCSEHQFLCGKYKEHEPFQILLTIEGLSEDESPRILDQKKCCLLQFPCVNIESQVNALARSEQNIKLQENYNSY